MEGIISKIPPFFKEDPRLWFAQAEAMLQFANISYWGYQRYLIPLVDTGVLNLLPDKLKEDLKTHWADTCACDTVKTEILRQFDELGKDEFIKLSEGNAVKAPLTSRVISNPTVLNLPKFCMESPETWFLQIEAIFDIANVTSDDEKCLQFMANLDPAVLPLINDMLPVKNFSSIKNRILTVSAARSIVSTPERADSCDILPIFKTFTAKLEKNINDLAVNESLNERVQAIEEAMNYFLVNVKLEKNEKLESVEKNVTEWKKKLSELQDKFDFINFTSDSSDSEINDANA